jgi:hypothetical protein
MKYDLTDVDITDYLEALSKIEQENKEYEVYELEETVRELAMILNLKPHRVNQDIMFAKLHGDKFQNLYDEAMDNDLRLLKAGGKSKIWLQKKRTNKPVKPKSKRKVCRCKK